VGTWIFGVVGMVPVLVLDQSKVTSMSTWLLLTPVSGVSPSAKLPRTRCAAGGVIRSTSSSLIGGYKWVAEKHHHVL